MWCRLDPSSECDGCCDCIIPQQENRCAWCGKKITEKRYYLICEERVCEECLEQCARENC